MSTITQLVDTLNSGGAGNWKIVGSGQPVEETQTGTYQDPTDVGAPPQVMTRGTGRYYVVVQDDQGHQRALFLKADPIKGGLVVPQTGVTDRADPTTNKTPNNVYDGDLSKLSWSQAGAVGDVPAGPKQPTATAQLDKIDANGNDPAQSGKPAVAVRDPTTGTVTQLPKDPAGSVTAVGDTMYLIKPDGSSQVVTGPDGKALTKPQTQTITAVGDTMYSIGTDGTGQPVLGPDGKPITKPKDHSQFNVPGTGLVDYDPATGQATTILPSDKNIQAKDLKPEVRNGTTFIPVDSPDGIVWQEAKGLPQDVQWTMASNDPRSSKIQLIGSNGETKTIDKADFHPPPSPQAGQAITPDATSPFVVTIGDNGQPVFTQNQNRLSITDAQQQLIQQLGLKVADGSMSEDQAKNLISSATQAMTAQASQQNAQANVLNAQQNVLQGGVQAGQAITQATQQGAQTGAGLLQNRVTAATGALQNLVGQAANAPHLMNVPSGLGQQLVGGLTDWATQLGGGQGVYDAAANLVKSADPSNSSGMASQGYAALQQMLQKYQDLTGQQHPAVDVVRQQAGLPTGFNAPQTSPFAAAPVVAPAPAPAPAPVVAPVQSPAGSQFKPGWPGSDPRLSGILNPLGWVAPTTVAPPAATVVV